MPLATFAIIPLPSRELTYPTLGKGKSSWKWNINWQRKLPLEGIPVCIEPFMFVGIVGTGN